MTETAVLACPSCKRRLRETAWHDEHSGRCESCHADFEAFTFPALRNARLVPKPQAVVVADDSTCFFHAENQAEKVCESCGRFLCSVCAVPFGGNVLCPRCIAAEKAKSPTGITKRALAGAIALSLALVPLLVWPFTVITAPLTIGFVIWGWNLPGSLVRGRGRWKMVVAGLIALAQISGWCFVLYRLVRHR